MGKRKTSEHCAPAYQGGMSKLKMLETVELITPKNEVPYVAVSYSLEMGTIRWGN